MATPISRRSFLSGAAGLAAAGALGRPLRHLAPRVDGMAHAAGLPVGAAPSTDRILVLVTLYGGNDGLNTVIPFGDPAYYQLRGAIAISQNQVLQIGDGVGLHPSLAGVKALWDAGNVAIVRGVGYPDPNLSHFTSMDIWQSAVPADDSATGWLGRWLDGTNAHPLSALWLGTNVPLAFVGNRKKASSVLPTTSPTSQLPPGLPDLQEAYALMQDRHYGELPIDELVGRTGTDMLSVSAVVAAALSRVPPVTKAFGSGAGSLGSQLAVVSQLIAAGVPTRAYGVQLGGFDSHAGEEASYAPLYKQLDAAIGGFFTSLHGVGRAPNVVMMIHTEFGRRVVPNASGGTDHGAANDVFIIGSPVKGGLYGDQPSLTQLDSSGNLVMSQDFRSVYATILDQVIDVEPKAVLRQTWPEIAFI